MSVTVAYKGPRLASTALSTAALMREIGLLVRERIIRRTLSGLDEDDHAFAPYSAGYAAAKQAALGTTGVNLQVSGRMLQGIALVDVTERSVTLGFKD